MSREFTSSPSSQPTAAAEPTDEKHITVIPQQLTQRLLVHVSAFRFLILKLLLNSVVRVTSCCCTLNTFF